MIPWLSSVTAGILISVISVNGNQLRQASAGKPSTLYCDVGSTDSQLEITWKTQIQLVARYSKGLFTTGPGFENRVRFENITSKGGFSLHINPTHFSDRGIYSCYHGKNLLKTWNLIVTGSSSQEVQIYQGGKVTLPCYGLVDRHLTIDKVSVQWKKEGKMVLNLTNGHVHHHPDFAFRANIFLDEIHKGDLSMQIKNIQMSDQGVYDCFCDISKGHILSSVVLSVIKGIDHGEHGNSMLSEKGEFIFRVPDQNIKILRSTGIQKWIWVCDIIDHIAKCNSNVEDRIVVEHGRVILKDLTKNDEGIYKVMDITKTDVMNEISLEVRRPPSKEMFLVVYAVLGLVVLWFIKKHQALVVLLVNTYKNITTKVSFRKL